ncbi:hypothetical protein V6N12_015999 [Hibiscus sabdariffa]|uniref:Uncharacterized protein n=1 Tax=Hibiscus sabdariffa TaxID=183260 RepID=A0ABR2DPU0_9ROSI
MTSPPEAPGLRFKLLNIKQYESKQLNPALNSQMISPTPPASYISQMVGYTYILGFPICYMSQTSTIRRLAELIGILNKDGETESRKMLRPLFTTHNIRDK